MLDIYNKTILSDWIMLFKHYGEQVHIGNKKRWYKLSIHDHLNKKEQL